jgi:hypothetical protein
VPKPESGFEVCLTVVAELAPAQRAAWERLWALLLQGTLASRDSQARKHRDGVEDGSQP